MNKNELAAKVADQADISKDKAAEVINAITDQITAALLKGESVSLIGFGSFSTRHRAARVGKNPRTGESLNIPASNTVGFKAGAGFKSALTE